MVNRIFDKTDERILISARQYPYFRAANPLDRTRALYLQAEGLVEVRRVRLGVARVIDTGAGVRYAQALLEEEEL